MPSYQEMCDLFGFASKKASYDMAKKLIEAGVLGKDANGKLTPKQLFQALPALGVIKAGLPAQAYDQSQEIISFDEYLVNKPESTFVLTVSGDSMVDAGILEGDIVIVDGKKEPKNDDIVAAFIDREWTLKYFRKERGKVALVAANPKYPTLAPKESLNIGGVVVGVVRKYR